MKQFNLNQNGSKISESLFTIREYRHFRMPVRVRQCLTACKIHSNCEIFKCQCKIRGIFYTLNIFPWFHEHLVLTITKNDPSPLIKIDLDAFCLFDHMLLVLGPQGGGGGLSKNCWNKEKKDICTETHCSRRNHFWWYIRICSPVELLRMCDNILATVFSCSCESESGLRSKNFILII